MILYFANRYMQILGHATTNLPDGFVVTEDNKIEEVETGVASFECRIGFNDENRALLEEMTDAGNYLLRSNDGENEFYTIIDTEIDTKNQDIYIYAEDAGLDLLNEIAPEFENETSYTAEWYINKYIADSGFEIGVNEIPSSSKRALSWDGEATVTERLASIANSFDGYEISYSFDIKGLEITNKYVNIYKERGKEIGEHLRLNRDIDRIVTTKSVANLATAFVCEGGTPEGDNDPPPITLKGYKYDDGDFYVDGDKLKSRNANKKWSRYIWNKEPNRLNDGEGYIVRPYSYDTLSQSELCNRAITELKKVCDMEVNYEIDINKLPDGVKIGDRINIVDDAGELYVSSRILKLETSVTEQTHVATLGEHLIKKSGISQKVIELAEQFAQTAKSAAKALSIANTAKSNAQAALTQANEVVEEVEKAQQNASLAVESAANALQSATEAQTAANEAKSAVDSVEKSVENLEATVTNAQTAADNAQQAATTAQTKATEAEQAAIQAKADAADAKASVEVAEEKADTAISKADTAINTADDAKTEATTAKETAEAAKLDAKKAEEDIVSLGERLTTVTTTMEVNYARKTDLTESTANLQTQISQNAAEISSTASRVQVIDETANNAKEQAEAAQTTAEEAQAQADQATADAQAAQTAANNAAQAATNAQTEADNAKAAAISAQEVANKAEADLETAKADLETVQGRVDATEADILAAQEAVNTAQAAADKAKADANTAAEKATTAQNTANTAVTNANNAQTAANEAATKAAAAQKTADEAKGDASAAQAAADEAASIAAQAKETANTAVTNASNAQAKADQAATEAATAKQKANEADAKAQQAAADLATAQQNLENVTSRVGATEAEVAAAQQAVETAQAAADKAKADAVTAQAAADQAKADATKAQTTADNAKTAADEAQKAADDAQTAADEAKAAAESLAVRVTKAETDIVQNSEKIELRATKEEVATTYDKTNSKGEQLIANGNGILGDNTNFSGFIFDGAETNNSPGSFATKKGDYKDTTIDDFIPISVAKNYTLSFDAKSLSSTAVLYSYINMYDVDKQKINAADYLYVSGTLTTLVQDLKDGDTVVYLTDVSKWVTNVTYANRISFWNYTNSFGYRYPPETYTRNHAELVSTSYKPADGCIDYSNNTVTLASAWSGGTVAAGTQVSQGRLGASYCYIGAIGVKPPTDWTTYTGYVAGGVNYSGVEVQTTKKKFFPATAYAKIGFFYNSSWLSDQLWITNVTFLDTTTTDALESRVTTTETKITQNSSAIELRATKTELNKAVDDVQVGGRNLLLDSKEERTLTRDSNGNPVFIYDFSPNLNEMGSSVFTVSFDAKTDGNVSADFYLRDNMAWISTHPVHTLTAEYKRYTNTVTLANGKTCADVEFCYLRLCDGTGTVYVKNVKLEKGNKVTDWTPAPEDVAEDIGAVGSIANDVSERLSQAEATIKVLSEAITQMVRKNGDSSVMIYEEDSATWYFDVGSIEDNAAANTEAIGTLQDEANENKSELEKLKDQVAGYEQRFTVGIYEDEPCIILHETDTDRVQIITNTKRIFARKVETTNTETGEVEVTYTDLTVSDYETLRSKKVEAEEVKVGGWVWQTRNNGRNFGLVWKGVDG